MVHRPDAGLARGRWEAPPWAFYVAASAVVILAAVYAAIRLGFFKRFARSARRSATKR
jgi:hypothetical protein